MNRREIPVNAWPAFAEALNRQYQSEVVSIFSESRRGERTPIAREVVFRNLAVDIEAGQRSVVVTVDMNAARHLSHTVSKPVAIFFDGQTVNVKSELGTGFTIELVSKEVEMTPIRDWGFDIEKFEAKAKESITNARGDLSEITGVLRESLLKTNQTLLDLQKSREPVASELRNGFERAWDEIEQAFARARKRVRESRDTEVTPKAGDDWLG
ncbi:MAG TPA: hypothetical protein VI258_14765 [Rhodanobacteraceae bacterium]